MSSDRNQENDVFSRLDVCFNQFNFEKIENATDFLKQIYEISKFEQILNFYLNSREKRYRDNYKAIISFCKSKHLTVPTINSMPQEMWEHMRTRLGERGERAAIFTVDHSSTAQMRQIMSHEYKTPRHQLSCPERARLVLNSFGTLPKALAGVGIAAGAILSGGTAAFLGGLAGLEIGGRIEDCKKPAQKQGFPIGIKYRK